MLIAAAAKRRKQKETRQEQAVRAQTIVHNDELAIRADDLLPLPGTERVRTSGSSAWQSMLPSAFLRCAFDGPTGTKKSTAERFKCGGTHAKHVQWMASDLCLTGQSSGISALQARHDVDYVIFSFMMDETSFRIRTVGDSPEVLPTLAMHGHLTWSERGETRNEDVVMMPAAMGNQTAGSLWPALVARAAPVDLLRPFPEAQLRALCPGSDHARAMQKVWNYLESRLPEDTFFCRGLCKQHATGLCVAPVTTFFDLLCPAFCSVKLLHQGHFHTNYMQGLYLTIHRSVTCILAVDAPAWRPKPADRDHAERLLECCFYSRDLHAIHASDEEVETHKARDKQRREAGARLISLCPGDWRKKRHHPLVQGGLLRVLHRVRGQDLRCMHRCLEPRDPGPGSEQVDAGVSGHGRDCCGRRLSPSHATGDGVRAHAGAARNGRQRLRGCRSRRRCCGVFGRPEAPPDSREAEEKQQVFGLVPISDDVAFSAGVAGHRGQPDAAALLPLPRQHELLEAERAFAGHASPTDLRLRGHSRFSAAPIAPGLGSATGPDTLGAP